MAEIDLRVRLDARAAETASNRLGRSFDETGRSARRMAGGVDSSDRSIERLRRSLFGIQNVLGAVGVSIGAGVLVRGLIDANREFQRLQAQLFTTEGSAEAGLAAFRRIEDFAVSTPFQIEELTEAFVRLRVLGVQPTVDDLTAIGDLAAAFSRRFIDVTEAIQSAAGGETEPLRRLGFQTKVTGDLIELTFRGASLTVRRSADEIVDAIGELTSDTVGGAMGRLMTTLDGQISNLEDAIGKLARAIGEAGLNDALSEMLALLTQLTNEITENEDVVRAFVDGIGSAFTALRPGGAFGGRVITDSFEDAADAAAAAIQRSQRGRALGLLERAGVEPADPFAQLREAAKRFAALEPISFDVQTNIEEELTPEAEKAIKSVQPLIKAVEQLERVQAATVEFGFVTPHEELREQLSGLVDLREQIAEIQAAMRLVPAGTSEFAQLQNAFGVLTSQAAGLEAGLRRAAEQIARLDAIEIPVPHVEQTIPIRLFTETVRLTHEARDGIDELNAALAVTDAVGGALFTIIGGLEGIDDATRRTLGGVLDLTAGFLELKRAAELEGTAAALGAISGAGAILGGLVGIGSALLQPDPERLRAIQQNTEALRDLSLELEGFRAGTSQNLFRVLNALEAGVAGAGGNPFRLPSSVLREILRSGLGMDELRATAEDLGIDAFTDEGALDINAIGAFIDALEIATTSLVGFRDTLEGTQRERELRDRILGVERTPQQQTEALFGDLGSFAPDLFREFLAGIDTSDTEAVRAALLAMLDQFAAGGEAFAELMGNLTRDEFLKWLDQAADSLESMDEAINKTTDAIRNVPTWFRVAGAVLNAADPDPFGGGVVPPPPVPPHPPITLPPGAGPRPGRPRTEPAPPPMTLNFNVSQAPGENGERFARRTADIVVAELERRNLGRTGNRHGTFRL